MILLQDQYTIHMHWLKVLYKSFTILHASCLLNGICHSKDNYVFYIVFNVVHWYKFHNF